MGGAWEICAGQGIPRDAGVGGLGKADGHASLWSRNPVIRSLHNGKPGSGPCFLEI